MRYQPIRYRQIRDILEWTQTFHQALAYEYERLSLGPVRERVAMLLTYLSEHEKALQNTIKHFADDAHEELLNTWHDHFPELDLPDNLDDLRAHFKSIDTGDVIRLAVKFHDVLIRLFEEIRDSAPTDEVRDVFANLVLMENHEKERIVRDTGMLEDL